MNEREGSGGEGKGRGGGRERIECVTSSIARLRFSESDIHTHNGIRRLSDPPQHTCILT